MSNEVEKWAEAIKELTPSSAALIENKLTPILQKLKTIELYTGIVLEQVPDIEGFIAAGINKPKSGAESSELRSLCFNLATQEYWLRLYVASLTPFFYFMQSTSAVEIAIGLEKDGGFPSEEAPIICLLLEMIDSTLERIILTDADAEIINAKTDEYMTFFSNSSQF